MTHAHRLEYPAPRAPAMRIVLSSMLLALSALFTLALGVWLAAWVALEARRLYGRESEMFAFFGFILILAGIAAALYRWQDTLMQMIGLPSYAVPETLYCQTCGTASSPDAVACVACGGTRFAISRPGQGAARWHVQIGMDVFGSDRTPIGIVKRRRVKDFLVARHLARDVYVPFSVISGANAREVHLSVPADAVGQGGWARPSLVGRPD